MKAQRLFEILYALAARDGREATLFGDSMPYAREALARGLCGDLFPELWFELPLAGEPWFDLHVLYAREHVRGGETFAGLGGAYADALAWFATSANTRQLALSFDSHTGCVDEPAVQLLLDRRGLDAPTGFLAAVGRSELADAYRSFVARMPSGWYACYSGVFPARADAAWVRVECIVGGDTQRAYAADAQVLREHLAQVGMGRVDDEVVSGVVELARSPFALELQFNVDADGAALPTLGASVRFQPDDVAGPDGLGAVGRVFAQAEARGLADGRWRELARTTFAKRVAAGDEYANIWCFPAFIKLRWRQGAAPDAKAYLMAGMWEPRPGDPGRGTQPR